MSCIAVLAGSEVTSRKSGFGRELNIFLNWKISNIMILFVLCRSF